MKVPIWKPSEEVKKRANITRFISFVNKKYGLKIDSYDELYDWSIKEIPDFWAAMWEFAPIKAEISSVVPTCMALAGQAASQAVCLPFGLSSPIL